MIQHHLMTLLIAALVLAVIASVLRDPRRRHSLTNKSPLKTKPVMTDNERDAYSRLVAAMPRHLILPQVSLGAFVDPIHRRDRPLRNYYDRLRADFVLCNTDAMPLAIIEIDDRSHNHPHPKTRDAKKHLACQAAALHIVRWPATPLPSIEEIRTRLKEVLG
jgi:Protein of unknown function (DUF2726)